eukprot:5508-Heterococcus_DN1.PRE.1
MLLCVILSQSLYASAVSANSTRCEMRGHIDAQLLDNYYCSKHRQLDASPSALTRNFSVSTRNSGPTQCTKQSTQARAQHSDSAHGGVVTYKLVYAHTHHSNVLLNYRNDVCN